MAHGERRCEKIGKRQKYARAVILSEAKNLALSAFAISHFHRQSEILRFAQDDRLADSFTPSFAMGHNLPPLRGSEGRVDVKLALLGQRPGSSVGSVPEVPLIKCRSRGSPITVGTLAEWGLAQTPRHVFSLRPHLSRERAKHEWVPVSALPLDMFKCVFEWPANP
ncbi:MAG: hypothetical protein ABSF46_00495 [Terriglobia bacterium]